MRVGLSKTNKLGLKLAGDNLLPPTSLLPLSLSLLAAPAPPPPFCGFLISHQPKTSLELLILPANHLVTPKPFSPNLAAFSQTALSAPFKLPTKITIPSLSTTDLTIWAAVLKWGKVCLRSM